MIIFDMAAYFTSLLIYNQYNFETLQKIKTEKKNNKKKKNKKKLEGFQRDQEILPHNQSKETFLNMLQHIQTARLQLSRKLTLNLSPAKETSRQAKGLALFRGQYYRPSYKLNTAEETLLQALI